MGDSAAAVFDSIAQDIRAGYLHVKPKLGWRFLYTPRSTFRPRVQIAVLALNPGGQRYATPSISYENGNAFRDERGWRDDEPELLNPFQEQMIKLFAVLSRGLRHADPDEIMKDSLVANLCPYRSASWSKLSSKDAALATAHKIWTDAFQVVKPKIMVTLGRVVLNELRGIKPEWFADSRRTRQIPTSWGAVECMLAGPARSSPLVIGLPHLSRFKVFGRPEGRRFEASLQAVIRDCRL